MHLVYGRPVAITSWPHRPTVHGNVDYAPTYAGHTGIDGYTAYDPYGWRVPLYALSDGIVEAVASPEDPNSRYMTYQYSGRGPAVRAGDLVWCVEHMDECVVKVGQWIAKGSHIGFQGYTGNVDPPGVGGTHSHAKVFRDPAGQATPYLVDPVPYVTGAASFPPSPKPEEIEMVTIPLTQYIYIDTPANVRTAPGGTLTGKVVQTGDVILIDAVANLNGYTWGRIPNGWVAIAEGSMAWAVPDCAPDQTVEIEALQAELDKVKADNINLTSDKGVLTGKLEQIKQIAG